ncbi:MAG: Zn-ribbon domain-containing OB-fold protein [Dehalococcoidia bacterium]|nr:Zn-ribbon domain-containing OB-fold protein [Dehalococcoidia bacterium]
MKEPPTASPSPGTPLSDEAIQQGKVLTLEWPSSLRYAWDTGIAIGRFLEELKNGRIIGRTCHKCERVLVPPRMFCERCFRPTDGWQFVQDSGTVNTFSISHLRWDASRIEDPILVAVIEIDGTSHGGFLHYLGEVKPDEIRIGMKVKAAWKPPEERTGSIRDIRYFRPA